MSVPVVVPKHTVVCWSAGSLDAGMAEQEEIKETRVCDACIDNCARQWISTLV